MRHYGTGTIREQRPGYYELRVRLRDPVTGQTRQVSKGLRGAPQGDAKSPPKEVTRALAKLVSEAESGRHVVTEGTLADLIKRWLRHASKGLAENTVIRYQGAADTWLLPTLGSRQVRHITAADLDALYDRMQEAGSAPASVAKVHATARRALNQARKWKWVTENVALDATPPTVRRTAPPPPSPADLLRLFAAAEAYSPEHGMFLRLAAASGGRRGEMCACRWDDVDLDAGELRIRRAVTVSGKVKGTKTHQERRVALDTATTADLKVYKTAMASRAADLGASYDHDAYLFSSDPAGRAPWNPSTPTYRFSQLRHELGLDHVRLHDLRHAHATLLIAAGVDIRTVASRLGHANTSTTLDIYAHALAAPDRLAADVMGRLLAS